MKKKPYTILSERLRQDYLARQRAEGRDFVFRPLSKTKRRKETATA